MRIPGEEKEYKSVKNNEFQFDFKDSAGARVFRFKVNGKLAKIEVKREPTGAYYHQCFVGKNMVDGYHKRDPFWKVPGHIRKSFYSDLDISIDEGIEKIRLLLNGVRQLPDWKEDMGDSIPLPEPLQMVWDQIEKIYKVLPRTENDDTRYRIETKEGSILVLTEVSKPNQFIDKWFKAFEVRLHEIRWREYWESFLNKWSEKVEIDTTEIIDDDVSIVDEVLGRLQTCELTEDRLVAATQERYILYDIKDFGDVYLYANVFIKKILEGVGKNGKLDLQRVHYLLKNYVKETSKQVRVPNHHRVRFWCFDPLKTPLVRLEEETLSPDLPDMTDLAPSLEDLVP